MFFYKNFDIFEINYGNDNYSIFENENISNKKYSQKRKHRKKHKSHKKTPSKKSQKKHKKPKRKTMKSRK